MAESAVREALMKRGTPTLAKTLVEDTRLPLSTVTRVLHVDPQIDVEPIAQAEGPPLWAFKPDSYYAGRPFLSAETHAVVSDFLLNEGRAIRTFKSPPPEYGGRYITKTPIRPPTNVYLDLTTSGPLLNTIKERFPWMNVTVVANTSAPLSKGFRCDNVIRGKEAICMLQDEAIRAPSGERVWVVTVNKLGAGIVDLLRTRYALDAHLIVCELDL